MSIFVWFVYGRRSLRWITRELNKQGAPKDHRATTPKWHHTLVTGVLKNLKYLGLWQWGENKNVRHPITGDIRQEKRPSAESEQWTRHIPELQLVDDETFQRAQQLLEENAEVNGKRRDKNGQLRGSTSEAHAARGRHLLSGIVECAYCHRTFIVGGANGEYLFCPNYANGECTCQTTLRRDLAEKLILGEVGKVIASNPAWVDRLYACAVREYERQLHEQPSRTKAIQERLQAIDKGVAILIANCEKQVIPEIEIRLTELRSERRALQTEHDSLRDKEGSKRVSPTREWVEQQLSALRSLLHDKGPSAAHALRGLVSGRVVVTEIRRPGKKRHYLRARLELRLRDVGGLIGAGILDRASLDETVDVVEIDIRRPERHELLADEAKRLWDIGHLEKEIAKLLGCGRGIVKKALDYWYERQGLNRPDGRTTKKRLKNRRKADKFQSQIMELWFQDLAVNEIAERIGCCLEIVHEAVTKWHVAQSLPVPDGRARRREIRLKRREAG